MFLLGGVGIAVLIDTGLPGIGGELVIPATALTFAIWGFMGVMALWDAVIAAAPRVEETARSGDGTQREYIQRSKTFGFPDHIAVRFIAEDAAGKPATRVLMFSAAQKGYYDFGVNRRRVTTWLETLCRKAAAAAAEKTGP